MFIQRNYSVLNSVTVWLILQTKVHKWNSWQLTNRAHSGQGIGLVINTSRLGLASISIWSRWDCQEYMAITCNQVQAWSRSFTLLVPVICCISYDWQLTGHLATVINCAVLLLHATRRGGWEAWELSQHQRPVKGWLSARRTQQRVVEGRGTGMYHITRLQSDGMF